MEIRTILIICTGILLYGWFVYFYSNSQKNIAMPELRVYPVKESAGEFFTMDSSFVEDSTFLLLKDLYCSDDPFAKELVFKYRIYSDNIQCDK